jgi:hypothetical protein
VRAMRGETIFMGRRGIPDAKLVSSQALILSDETVRTLANGLGESQAQRMFARAHRPGARVIMQTLPDNNAADTIADLAGVHGDREVAAAVVVALILESHRLYRNAGEKPPSLEAFLSGIAVSAGQHPELTDNLRDWVMPKIVAILRQIASFENDPPEISSTDRGDEDPVL